MATGKKLSMGQMLSMVGEERSKRRRQQASDGAGDQQFDALIKLIEDALQLEDDLTAVKQTAENKKHKKNEKEEKMRDRAEKLRKAAMQTHSALKDCSSSAAPTFLLFRLRPLIKYRHHRLVGSQAQLQQVVLLVLHWMAASREQMRSFVCVPSWHQRSWFWSLL